MNNRNKQHKNWYLDCQQFDKPVFKQCDYCKESFNEINIGNHPTNDFNEKYCDGCYDELKKINEL